MSRALPSLVVVAASLSLTSAAVPQQATKPDIFPVVRATGYEGAIVPSTSPWHQFYKVGLTILDGKRYTTPDLPAWTPDAADIAVVERHIAALLKVAAGDAAKAAAMVPEPSRQSTARLLPWLVEHSGTLKRTYYGITLNGARHVLLHAVHASDDRWRYEPIMMMDGGCGNAWFEVGLTEGVRRFVCGSDGAPAR